MNTQRLMKIFGMMLAAGTTAGCMSGGDSGPATCKDAKSTYGVSVDGPQTLYLNGDKSMPWPAYCVGMTSSEPREFLALPQYSAIGAAANFSEFREGGLQITTHYEKVRFDPATLTIDITDKTFVHDDSNVMDPSMRTSATLGNLAIGYMPFGVGMQCAAAQLDSAGQPIGARANIDLTGLPFQLSDQQMCSDPGGSKAVTDPSSPTKVVTFTAIGSASSCAKASVRCLPNPTVNGQVGGQTTIPVHYEGSVGGFGF